MLGLGVGNGAQGKVSFMHVGSNYEKNNSKLSRQNLISSLFNFCVFLTLGCTVEGLVTINFNENINDVN